MTEELSGRRVTVMGLGRFGGGVGVTRWLVASGADVIVTDLLDADALAEPLAQLDDLRGRFDVRLGGHNVADFTDTDLVVANPAVPRPWENRFLRCARAGDVPITTEIRLTVDRLDRNKVIGVTGTAGKSTTSAMIHHALRELGFVAEIGGNLGGSLLPRLEEVRDASWIVLELSSAMLHWLRPEAGRTGEPGWSPRFAVQTNLAPNHIDWHGSLAHYTSSKWVIFDHQQRGDVALTERDRASDDGLPLAVPGAHNRENAALAVAAVEAATGLDAEAIWTAVAGFPGLPDRLQFVREHAGRRFINDSKSTTPEAAVRAVEAFDAGRVHLIAGGYDKAVQLDSIIDLTPTLAGLYTIGATGPGLAAAARGNVYACATLDAAVACAWPRMREGDVLLMSPGCASWDQFPNYQARGARFVTLVTQLALPAVDHATT